jgi:hypothetical protein
MKDGEYSLLGGLSSDSDQQSVSGLPGFSAVPVLGYLFGTRTKDREKDDILIALVPHIIRAQPMDDQLADGVLAGTEKMVRVERKQPPPVVGPIPPAPGTTPRTTPAPQLPPPGGQAQMLPPTNNPKLPINTGTVNTSSMTASSMANPAWRTAPIQRAQAAPPPVAQAPPGMDVTPLEGMQQMGLAPDPSPESDSSAASGLTAGQDLPQPTDAEPAPVQVAPESLPAPGQSSPESISSVPSPRKSDGSSYAVIEPESKTAAAQKAQAVAKNKAAHATKVHLASETSTTPVATTTKTATPPAASAAKPSGSQVQLLEGHLTQEPDSTTTSNPKQPK